MEETSGLFHIDGYAFLLATGWSSRLMNRSMKQY